MFRSQASIFSPASYHRLRQPALTLLASGSSARMIIETSSAEPTRSMETPVPVKIGSFEPLPEDEFNALRQQKANKTDPAMVALLAEVGAGQPVRVPLVDGQSARGLRTAISRAATSRGLTVETVEGDGFVAVRKVDAPRASKQTLRSGESGKRRGRPAKRQHQSLDEVLAAADNERIVPEPVIET
jgi:hypothetical protein